ncbi:MAG: esterase family protein [Bacteroidales bacterium]|nr:esterase family protein [Bacteroidales bacterium]
MKRSPLLICVLLLFVCSCANVRYAHVAESSEIEGLQGYRGTIRAVRYKSSEKAISERRMVVYLPESYSKEPERRYPVMYLLHGARGNEVTWIERGEVLLTLDSLRLAGSAEEFILVLPNVNNYFSEADYKGGHAVNAVRAFWIVDGETETHFMQDAVATVDSLFRTIPEKSGRAVAGMSTGGLQAIYLSANYPDSFGYVGLFSPYAYDTVFGLRHPEFYGGLGRKMKRQFAEAPEYYGIMIGDTDFFYPHMILWDRSLNRKGYKHQFVVTPGGHEWYNWRKYFILFSKEVFRQPF